MVDQKNIKNKANEIKNPVYWMNLKYHCVTSNDIHTYAKSVIQSQKKATFLYLNVHGAILAWKNDWLKEFYNEASLVYCDGDGVRWGLRFLGLQVSEKIPLTRWIWAFSQFCEKESLSFFLLGGKPDVAERAGKKLSEKYPQLKIKGIRDGYYDHWGDENTQIVEEINQAAPDILVVSFGMPEQEKWIKTFRDQLNVPIVMTGGGVLDYVSGRLGKAPKWMVQCHLEWLFRILEEPRRLFWRYFTDIPLFYFNVVGEKIRRLFSADPEDNDGNRL